MSWQEQVLDILLEMLEAQAEGDLREALGLRERAFGTARAGVLPLEDKALGHLEVGQRYQEQGHLVVAAEQFNIALAIFLEMENAKGAEGQAGAHLYLGLLSRKMEREGEAVRSFTDALAAARIAGSAELAATALQCLAELDPTLAEGLVVAAKALAQDGQ